jgi:hypothetical protein
MNTETKSPAYMLLFRGTDWAKALSPEEIQKVMGEWRNWFDRLTSEGKVKAGHPLEPEGKVVTSRKGRVVVADGPFAESKETVGGYFFLEVADMDEALAIAKECPALPHGAIVEVRPVADMCPCARMVEEQFATASVGI